MSRLWTPYYNTNPDTFHAEKAIHMRDCGNSVVSQLVYR